MTDVAIRVEGLSKLYQLGATEHYRTLRETLTDTLLAPFRRMRRGASPREEEQTLWALRDVSFEVKHGEVIGIIGRNGAGKSTLLKILSRITEPTEGHAEIHGRVGSLLEVGTGFHPELSGRENIFLNGAILGMKKAEIHRKFDEIVAFAEIDKFIDTPVKRYSSGMYMRLAFAVAAHMETEILLVDEVLAVGDSAFQKKCLGKMNEVAQRGRTVFFVSHNLGAIRTLCPRSILLQDGQVAMSGHTGEVLDEYQKMVIGSTPVLPDGWIFSEPDRDGQNFQITGVQIMDADLRPKARLTTWDLVNVRVHFRATRTIKRGSVVLQIDTLSGVSVLLCSNEPDSNVPLEITPGRGFVDIEFQSWPLSAGTYVLRPALAIPMLEWLTPLLEIPLEVHGRDVFGSGVVIPSVSRAIVVTPHRWSVRPSVLAQNVSAPVGISDGDDRNY